MKSSIPGYIQGCSPVHNDPSGSTVGFRQSDSLPSGSRSFPRSEAHRAPDPVDGDLAHASDVPLEQMLPQDVPIQVRAELPRFRICDPGETVRLRGLHDRTAPLVDIGERLTKTRIASGLADDVTTTSSRSTPTGLPTTRTIIPSFRFSFLASLVRSPPHTRFVAQTFAAVRPFLEIVLTGLCVAMVTGPDRRYHGGRSIGSLRWSRSNGCARNFKFYRPVWRNVR